MTTSWTSDADRVQRYRDSQRARVIPLPRRPRDNQPTAQCAWHAQPAPGCQFCADSGPGPMPRPAWVETALISALLGLAAAVLLGCAYVGISR